MTDTPVVLIHGFATSAERTWREPGWLDLISEAGRPVIAVDLLGHGNAPKPHDPSEYERLEEAVLAELPEQPVDAIGFSMGARVLLMLASTHPERFRRIVLAGIGKNVFAREGGDAIARAVEGDFDPDNMVLAHFNSLGNTPDNDPAALAAFMRRESPPLTRQDLARVTAPALVVVGEQDFVMPADELVEALPNARFLLLPRVDHFGTPKDFTFIDEALGFIEARPF